MKIPNLAKNLVFNCLGYWEMKFGFWKKYKNKIRLFRVKVVGKKIGWIKQNFLVSLGKNNYGENDYLAVKLYGFLLFRFLLGRLVVQKKVE